MWSKSSSLAERSPKGATPSLAEGGAAFGTAVQSKRSTPFARRRGCRFWTAPAFSFGLGQSKRSNPFARRRGCRFWTAPVQKEQPLRSPKGVPLLVFDWGSPKGATPSLAEGGAAFGLPQSRCCRWSCYWTVGLSSSHGCDRIPFWIRIFLAHLSRRLKVRPRPSSVVRRP